MSTNCQTYVKFFAWGSSGHQGNTKKMLHNLWMSDYSYNFSRYMTFFPPLSTEAGISAFWKKHGYLSSSPFRSLLSRYWCTYFGSLWFWFFSATQEEMKNPSSGFPGLANAKAPSTRRSVSTLGFSSDLVSGLWEIPYVPVHIRLSVCSWVCNIYYGTFSCYQWKVFRLLGYHSVRNGSV